MQSKFYVGIGANGKEVFKSASVPTETTHGEQFAAVIGPFRTKRGATYMARTPGVPNVAAAERWAKNRAARNCGAIGSEVEIWITDKTGREFEVEPAPEPRAFSAAETMQAAMEVLGVSLSQEQFFEAAAALERRLNV